MTANLRTFADGEHVGIGGAHARIDENAAIDLDPGLLGEPALGRMPAAMTIGFRVSCGLGQLDAFDLALAEDRLGLRLGEDLEAARLKLSLQHVAGGWIELTLHQRRHQMHTVTSMSRALSPAAASRPSRPPPMTTAFARDCAAMSMALTSSRSR